MDALSWCVTVAYTTKQRVIHGVESCPKLPVLQNPRGLQMTGGGTQRPVIILRRLAGGWWANEEEDDASVTRVEGAAGK